MWRINKPNPISARNDVDKLNELGYIPDAEVGAMKQLVRDYDLQGGSITDIQHLTINVLTRNKIHAAYERDKLYDKDKAFHKVRLALYENVDRCPFCSVNQANETLDHYMPKGTYKALAMCRLNLVPICWRCNRQKSTKPYTYFAHPYYAEFPADVIFFKAEVKVRYKHVAIRFYVDDTSALDPVLKTLLKKQIENLKLNQHLKTAAISFLQNSVIGQHHSPAAVLSSIPAILVEKVYEYGLNDWRCAVLRAVTDAMKSTRAQDIIDIAVKGRSKRRDSGA